MEAKTTEWIMMHLLGTLSFSFVMGLAFGYALDFCDKFVRNSIYARELKKAGKRALE